MLSVVLGYLAVFSTIHLVIDFGFHCLTEICNNVIGSFCAEESSDIHNTNFYGNVKAISD